MRIRAYHERENRAIAHERVVRVDCVDSVFVIVCVITVPVRWSRKKEKEKVVTREIASIVIEFVSSRIARRCGTRAFAQSLSDSHRDDDMQLP
jgi:hypothetical protein